MTEKHLFTSESVSEGHPDKIADQISDSILDAMLEQDPEARVAVETTVTTGLVVVVGEVSTTAHIDIQKVVRETIKEIGYKNGKYGFDGDNCAVITAIDEQSPDIALGVDNSLEVKNGDVDPLDQIGAGDQGMMFGYAINETPELMPLPISLSHHLMKKVAEVRKNGTLAYLGPDAKAQVTVEYDDNNQPLRIDTVVLSTQHDENISLDQIRKDVMDQVITKVIPDKYLDSNTKYFINPTGRFLIGGPQGDAGLTGRKIIVDTYGGYAHHGGGAFSGKDATKVDRSAAYAARNIAKTIVAAKKAKKCEIQLAYAIGVKEPVSIYINTYNTSTLRDEVLLSWINRHFDLSPRGIIDRYELRKPQYLILSETGHFRNPASKWEVIDQEALNDLINL